MMFELLLITTVCILDLEATAGGQPTSRPAADAPAPLRTVAVLPAECLNSKEAMAGLEDGLGDMLAVLLADNPSVKVVERVHLQKVLREKELSLTGVTEAPRAAELGGLLKADCVVTSSLETGESGVTIRCSVIEVEGARIVHTVDQTGGLADILDLTRRCVQGIAEGLDTRITNLHPEELDRTPRISLLFMRGLSFYHEGLYERSQVEFMKIILLDPMHEHARAFSAMAFDRADQPEHARIAAEWFLKNFPNSQYEKDMRALLIATGTL